MSANRANPARAAVLIGRLALGGLCLGLPALGLLAPLAAVSPARAQQGGGMPVLAVTVAPEPLVRTLTAVGSLRANETVVIRPETSGRVHEFGFEEGRPVQRGEVLVRLDDAVERARLASAEAALALSTANWRRAEELARRNNVSEAAREEAFSRMKVDQAAVAVARTQLDKMVVRAPFDGLTGLRAVSVGAYVQAGQDVVDLVSLDPIKVDFRVPEVFAGSLTAGQAVRITVDALGERAFTGEVYAVDPQVDVNGRSVLLRARVANPAEAGAVSGPLRPGMFARVTLVLEDKPDAIMVPEEALVPRGRTQLVAKVIDGKANYVPVRTGQRKDGKVEILDGVAAGDVVITAGQIKVAPGAPVTVLPPPAPAPESAAAPAGNGG